ncbi:MAG: processing protein [Solirubrobacteraceae bacterium]|jgi:DNA processing protein|nr:processing protein [Solirubrobacteraceae bacterium]
MTAEAARATRATGACESCIRRSWLLAELSAPLDFWAHDRSRLVELLELEDAELLQAVGGRRRAELEARYRRFQSTELPLGRHIEAVCRHARDFPPGLRAAPRMLYVSGGAARLATLAAALVVAIVGSARASDYGMEMAKSLGRRLAAAGVTVTSGLGDGIALAAHAGALELDRASVAVMDGGLDVACPPRRRATYERLMRRGCAVAELPCDRRGRRWGSAASARIVAALAQLTVTVEASKNPRELAPAHAALTLGRTVAALPGRVTSAQSAGTNSLLREGAPLVRGAQDVLDLLHVAGNTPAGPAAADTRTALAPRLRNTLELVGAGRDTAEKLTRDGADLEDVLLMLSELELMGLLARGDGGRYVPREALAASRKSG